MNVPLFERHNWRSSLGAKYFKRPEKASVLNETTGNAIVQAKNKMALRFIVLSNASGEAPTLSSYLPQNCCFGVNHFSFDNEGDQAMDPRSSLAWRREQTDPQRIVTLLQRLQLGDVRYGSGADVRDDALRDEASRRPI